MYPVEIVMDFESIFEFVYLGFGVSIVSFLIIYFMCYGFTIVINVIRRASR